ncbi:unnamed protein product [Acanthoscelides obtectus]|uniref:BESS domain-containing protein n=1 Tax=Acanthoscelides obtectus TaxID=200917 RepID=A0A9P0P5R3_ACAOB|nr:unnamed protein product [Acanthoscelides obtectus]CAK1656009.1 hypothetical protein AOBTE_LOCUS19509 [Acanthoscelides obtectus]
MKVAQNITDSSLDKETEQNENTPSPLLTQGVPSLPGPSRYVPANRKRSNQAIDDFEAQALEALQEKENRHLSFFKGILPSLADFTELQTLTFQSGVIKMITEMRFGEQSQSTTWQSRRLPTGQQYISTPSESSEYQTGLQVQPLPPSPSGYQTAEYSSNTTFSNFTDDSQEEEYNFALLSNNNT